MSESRSQESSTNQTHSKALSWLDQNRAYAAFLWVILIVVTAYMSVGWIQPDEQGRVLEPAHWIAYGYAALPWELHSDAHIVSFFLGVVFSPVLMLTKYFGASGMTEAFIMRLIAGLIASTRIIALPRILTGFGLPRDRTVHYIVIMTLALFGPIIFVRTNQENYATTALVWSIYAYICMKDKRTFANTASFGFLLALTFACRPQAGIAAASLGLFALYKHGPRIIPASAVGLVVGLLPMAVVDCFYTTGPFMPVKNYLMYALNDEGDGHIWGTSPWWTYFKDFFATWYPPLSLFIWIPLIWGLLQQPVLAAIFVPFTVAHMLLGHKELRYFIPMVPVMQVATFVGVASMIKTPKVAGYVARLNRPTFVCLKIFIPLTIVAGALTLNTSPRMYNRLGELLRVGTIHDYTYIGNTMSSVAQFFVKAPDHEPTHQFGLDETKEGKVHPQGWLVFYNLDPNDLQVIQNQCRVDYQSISPSEVNMILLMPRSPARRRLNLIAECTGPFDWNLKGM